MFKIINKIKRGINVFFPSKSSFGSYGKSSTFEFPIYISCPKSVYLEGDLRIRQGTKILISEKSRLTIKKYSVIGMNNMIIPNKHKSTVGIPQILLGISGINDQNNQIIIEEDVWTGANVTIMGDITLGRGCVCGACCLVTKDVPPYAIVLGTPAHIVAVKFSIDQIIEHEKILYPEHERLTRVFLEELFEKYYKDMPIFGVSTNFTEEQIKRLKYCIEQRNFTHKDYIEKLKIYNKNQNKYNK